MRTKVCAAILIVALILIPIIGMGGVLVLLTITAVGYTAFKKKGKSPSAPSKFRSATPPARNTRSKKHPLQWIECNQPTEVFGYVLPGAFYVGSSIGTELDEPSTITLDDPVGVPLEPHVFTSSYYPTYQGILPNEKATYLKWLSDGLNDANPSNRAKGYLFIYFYGLERRVLFDGDLNRNILEKVEHLLQVYGPSHPKTSFSAYLSDFLHFCSYQLGHSAYRSLWPRYIPLHEQKVSENILSLILANLHETDEPLDWTMGYRIAKFHDDSKKSVVVSRSGERFHQLFETQFKAAYPEGLKLKSGKRNKKVRYHSANASLFPRYNMGGYNNDGFVLDVPNVYALKSQFKKLPQIWNQCIDELSGYSRAIKGLEGTHDNTLDQKLKAYLALPEALRNKSDHPLSSEFNNLLAVAEKTEGGTIIPCSAIAALVGIPERPTLTKVQSLKVAELISSMDHICAPNPSHIGLPLRWGQDVVIADKQSVIDIECPKLLGALRLLYLTIMVAAADGDVSDEEMLLFSSSLESLDFSDEQKDEIGMTIKALLRDMNMAVKNLNKISKEIPVNNRESVFRHLVAVAAADEVVTSDEKRILIRIQKAMDLPVNTLDDILADSVEFRTVEVTTAKQKSKGETIPPPATQTPSKTFSLDMSKIESLTEETRSVVELLSEVLRDDDDDENEVPEAEVVLSSSLGANEWLETLDSPYRQPLLQLLDIEAPTLDDLQKITQNHHIMHSVFVDKVNDWADEHLGDFIIEISADEIEIFRDYIPTPETTAA